MTNTVLYGWEVGEQVSKWWRGRFVSLYRLRKSCAQCGRGMVIDVTKAAIAGTAKNAGLHIVRCEECRNAARSEGATSRPVVLGSAPTAPTDVNAELEQLRMANKIMKEELDGFYHKKLPWE